MQGAERSCRARGSYSHLYKCFWLLESVDIGVENVRDRVMRPSCLQKTCLRGYTFHWSATLLDTRGGQVGEPYLDMVLVCFSTVANHCERQIVSVG